MLTVEMSPSTREILQDDVSQFKAVEQALTHDVTLIQGPPGTGKSFVGVQITKSLLENDPNTKILCLCYTNHALDDFLESLVKNGVELDDIIRMGGSPKISPALKDSILDTMKTDFSYEQQLRYGSVKDKQRDAQEEMEEFNNFLCTSEWHDDPPSWELASEFLIDEYPDVHAEFANSHVQPTTMWKRWHGGNQPPKKWPAETEVEEDGKARSSHGKSIWDLNLNQRRVLLKKWSEERRRVSILLVMLLWLMSMLFP